MDKSLTEQDIDEKIVSKVYTQSYAKKPHIDGVKVFPLKNHVGEDGDLSELIKTSENGEVEDIPGFKIAQINSTKLFPGTIKGWHLHFKQNDLWHVLSPGHLIVGLWDIRKSSPTNGAVMRLALGGGNHQLLFIPKGVAHGAINVSQKEAKILYFVDQKFNIENPDEKRIPWDSLGAEFWTPTKD